MVISTYILGVRPGFHFLNGSNRGCRLPSPYILRWDILIVCAPYLVMMLHRNNNNDDHSIIGHTKENPGYVRTEKYAGGVSELTLIWFLYLPPPNKGVQIRRRDAKISALSILVRMCFAVRCVYITGWPRSNCTH